MGDPLRTCVGCGVAGSQKTLLRFAARNGVLRLDLDRSGDRGVYVCPMAACLDQALKRRAIERALHGRGGVVRREDLGAAIQASVEEKARRLLGLARRAGKVVAGHGAVMDAMERKRAHLLVLARDVSAGGKRRLRTAGSQHGLPLLELLTQNELGEVLATSPRGSVAVCDAGFAAGLWALRQPLNVLSDLEGADARKGR